MQQAIQWMTQGEASRGAHQPRPITTEENTHLSVALNPPQSPILPPTSTPISSSTIQTTFPTSPTSPLFSFSFQIPPLSPFPILTFPRSVSSPISQTPKHLGATPNPRKTPV